MNNRTVELGREMLRPIEEPSIGEVIARSLRRKFTQVCIFVLWFFAVGGVATTFVLCKYEVTVARPDAGIDDVPMKASWNPVPKPKHSKVYR